MVEQRTRYPEAAGSIPAARRLIFFRFVLSKNSKIALNPAFQMYQIIITKVVCELFSFFDLNDLPDPVRPDEAGQINLNQIPVS